MPAAPSRKGSTMTTRRRFLTIGAGAFAVAAIPFAARIRRRLVRRTLPVMGTIAEIALVAEETGRAHAAIDAAFEELHAIDRTMSRFKPTSDIGRINAAKVGEGVAVSAQTARVLEQALRWAQKTDGAFDPCLGKAIELWDVTSRTEPPQEEAFTRLANRKLYRGLDLDRNRVVLRDKDIAIDLGGIAKGHAVDRAARILREHGYQDALVNAGGDLMALGESEDHDPWRIGVIDPNDPTRIIRKITVRDQAVATSGDYTRYFDHSGRRYHHLLDPATAAPRRTLRHSVTVTAADCMTADVEATVRFVTGRV